MKRTTWAAVAGAVVIVFVVGRNIAAAKEHSGVRRDVGCSAATIGGDYGLLVQGTQALAEGGVESFNGVILRSYDGNGNLTQVDNVKGSVSGWTPDRPGSGTYVVNADCTGSTRFEPAPGVIVETRFIVVDDGNEIQQMTSVPQGFMVTGVQKRIHRR